MFSKKMKENLKFIGKVAVGSAIGSVFLIPFVLMARSKVGI